MHASDYEAGRRAKGGRYTDGAWRRNRAAYLKAHPWCVACAVQTPATDVDHIVPRAQGGADHWPNLQALCHPCHSRKTVTHDGGFGNPTALPDYDCTCPE